MKIISLLITCLLTFTAIPSFASSVHDSDKNFCSAFIEETISTCVHSAGGTTCNISRNYQGMQNLYYALLSSMGGLTGNLDLACQVATASRNQASEARNCVNKWKCFNGDNPASTCINPKGTHC